MLNAGPAQSQDSHIRLVNSSQSTMRSAAKVGCEPQIPITTQAVNTAMREAAPARPKQYLFIVSILLCPLCGTSRASNDSITS